MKKLILILVLSGWFTTGILATNDNGVEPGLSYLKAKQAAELRDMKYVLYFKADWCTPCKWMDETTFQDERFTAAIDNNFIFVPLDIDEFEGYALKQYFQVYTLPTFLVFNQRHEIVNRAEGSLGASAFFRLLETDMKPAVVAVKHQQPEVVNSRPAQQEAKTEETFHAEANHSSLPDLPSEIIEAVTKHSVQLGAFSSLINAQAVQDRARQYTTEHVEITTIPNGDKMIYKVFAGRLSNEGQAGQLKKSLASYGLDGFVTSIVVSLKS